jgi:hypothetical protein
MKNKTIYIILPLYLIASVFTLFYFDGTGDSGDSIQHYLFAKYAPVHPELYFDHWAKPLFVLLASPFASFGFEGVKLFNVLIALLTIFITFKIAQLMDIGNAILIIVFIFFSPLYFILTFSGLTEPLFALFISLGLYAILRQQYSVAGIIVSFLPFIRSEGLIFLGVFGLYFLLSRKWKLIPLLLFGHIVYSIAGYFIHHDLLWVFTKVPYAYLSSTYGSGTLFHFVDRLVYVIGVPIYILFWFGLAAIIFKSFKKRIALELQLLVFFGFFAFFIAHTLFWYLGIFNSMGLKRVFVGVMPLMAIISLMGFNFITEDLFQKLRIPKYIIQALFMSYILVFPFTNNPAAINWDRDMNLTEDQKCAIQVSDFITANKESDKRFVFAHPYLSEVLNVDYFDSKSHLELNKSFVDQIKDNDIIIWENWFALVERGITKDYLDNDPNLVNIFNLRANDKGREILYSVYRKE